MSKLIINADDYGLRESCSLAIIEAFNKGFVSSTTMCANGQYFNEAIRLSKEHGISQYIGIHLNITEGIPLTEGIKRDLFFCNEKGEFRGSLNRYKPLTFKQAKLLYDELNAQIQKLKENDIAISHADSHHHIHTGIFFLPVVSKVLKENNIKKIRIHRNIGDISLFKKIGKLGYNLTLKHVYHFDTLQYFGDVKDIYSLKNRNINSLEIMVHPEYNIRGCLIDRTVYEGFPEGEEMKTVIKSIKNKIQEELHSY